LNQLRTEPWIPNQDETQVSKDVMVDGFKGGRKVKKANTCYFCELHWWNDCC